MIHKQTKDAIDWLPETGIPDDWITLFGRTLEFHPDDLSLVSFDQFDGSEQIREFAVRNGFGDKLDDHLHLTKCIEMDLDCFIVEWHISFPSDKERVAWLLTMDHKKHIQGWY